MDTSARWRSRTPAAANAAPALLARIERPFFEAALVRPEVTGTNENTLQTF
jgi:hypothetical protein